MKKIILFLFLISNIVACTKSTDFSKEFKCKLNLVEKSTGYLDFKNNFKLYVPSNWKIKKHYSELQSEIFCADTVKQLSETFILNASYNLGEIKLDNALIKQSDSLIKATYFEKSSSGLINFHEKPAYFYVVKGTKNGFPYHQLNLIVKNSETTYFTAYSEIYGDKLVDERICESISILEKIEFLQ